MLKSSVKIHDKFSVVVEVSYEVIFKKKKSTYATVTFLFFPDALNINERKYPKTKFYNDVRLFLKYDIAYSALTDLNTGKKSLLKKVERSTDAYLKDRSQKQKILYEQRIKMLASTFSNLLKEEIDDLIQHGKQTKYEIEILIEKINTILAEFRLIVAKVAPSSLDQQIKNVIFYADEHMSNSVELQLMQLYNDLDKREKNKEIQNQIVSAINAEQKYKKQEGYHSPKDKDKKPEDLLYKRNQLKKFMDSVFFLKQDIRKDGAVFEQTLLALAAGLAMIFSTGIAFYFQKNYGNFTTPFFVALVVSYMLKDRIKGLISGLFVSKSNSFFYDYKIRITNSLNRKIGVFKEDFGFVPYKKLEESIKKLRLKELVLDVDMESLGEQIIQYKKKIVLYPSKFGSDLSDSNISGITDITRFNFHRFIQYMDDPKKDYTLVKKREVYTKFANKVYHINIIQKYFTVNGVEYTRNRVIMNRNGILRIDNMSFE
jgi:hypothetical protein